MKKRLTVISLLTAVISAGLVYLFLHFNVIPNSASVERQSMDQITQILFAIASVFFTLVIVIMLDTVIFFRRRKGDNTDGPGILGYAPLEIVWTLVPLVIVLTLGTYGGIVLDRITSPPPPPQTEMEIDVLSFRFGWQFTYPEYKVQSFELRLPVDRPVVLHLQSKDVIHAFWVPEFGPKQDAVPGMTTDMRFTPTKIGRYQVYCSQLCGYGHTYMVAPVAVVSPSDFQTWVNGQPKTP